MNASAYQIILGEIAPLLTEKGYETRTEGELTRYVGPEKAVSVVFDEEKRLFELQTCAVADGQPDGRWQTLSSWLFADDATDKDARSIGRDFNDSLLETLGIKPTVQKQQIALPSKTAGGDTPTSEALIQRFLTLVPAYKDAYREHVAANGVCRTVAFLEETAVPHIRGLLDQDNKKQLEKLTEMLDEMYRSGTKEVSALVSTVMLGESIGDSDARLQTALSYMEEYKYLATAVQNVVPRLRRQAARQKK